jgi:hypothetical protein
LLWADGLTRDACVQFGGEDSDLTELEDSDNGAFSLASSPHLLVDCSLVVGLILVLDIESEEGPAARSRTASPALRRSASPARSRSATRSPSPDHDDDAGDEYRDESARLKKMKIAKKKRSAEDEGDEPRP